MVLKKIAFSMCLLASTFAQANWQLDSEQSNLSFVSVKKDVIAETHHFTSMQGKVTKSGIAKLVIDLSSIESNIDIRNERMKKHLFEVERFANATIETKFSPALVTDMKEGESVITTLPFTLDLHGNKQTFDATVRVSKLADKLLVSSMSTVIISAAKFDMVKGIQKLAELAKLPNITMAVPVNFNLAFEKK